MIIAVSNQKGGQGKTTTAQALATGATMKGRKVLAVDLDPQSNLTFSMDGAADQGVCEILTGKATAEQVIQTTPQGDLLAANKDLATADFDIIGNRETRLFALARALNPIKDRYDHIIIDCPPALNILLINALMAADKVIIPLTADMYSLQGLYQLVQTIRDVQQDNKIGGVLFVKHNRRTILSRDLTDVIEDKCAELKIPVYKTTIREGIAVREAQTCRQSLFEYAPRSNPTKDYTQLLEEIGL